MIGVVRSELLRLRRLDVLLGWFGLMVTFTVLVNFVMFQVVDPSGTAPADGPGVSFPDAATLAGGEGLAAGLGAAATFLGVVTLSFWALAAATDHSTGLVRITVAAEPRRWRLLLGKWLALASVTVLTTTAVTVLNAVVAPVAAEAGGFTPDAWTSAPATVLATAWVDLFLSLLVWGSIGLALATVTRSAGVAIGAGVGYVLLVEAVIAAVASDVADWLPGSILTAIAQGGAGPVSYAEACVTGGAYVAVALTAAFVVFRRRDITD